MREGGCWSRTAQGHPPIDVPERHIPSCVPKVCSSTHKASMAMVLSWIRQWWRLDIFFGVRLDGVGVGRRPMALVVAGNSMDQFVFLDLLRFSLQSFQDNHCIPVRSLVSIYVTPSDQK
jgi:hypothetical protein